MAQNSSNSPTTAPINLGDVDDYLSTKKDSTATESLIDYNKLNDGNFKQKYSRSGTFFRNAETWKAFANEAINESFKAVGYGSYNNSYRNFLARLDRHGDVLLPTNNLNRGYTFITRPRLNMSRGNILQHPILANLLAADKDSLAYMIRNLLDTRLSRRESICITSATSVDLDKEPETSGLGLVDVINPFFTPLCNGLTSVSGFPDLNLNEETIGQDFHSGDFTYMKGSDLLNRTQELSLEFRDVQGSVILSCLFYWCLYMALQAKNIVQAYPDDIYEQRLNYTVSIYRFITDGTRKNIVWWSKATGCFPKSAPVGALFNMNDGEVTISAAKTFSIPFVANMVEYNNPGILYDFRTLVRRYVTNNNLATANGVNGLDNFSDEDIWPIVQNDVITGQPRTDLNFIGLPDVIANNGRPQLVWRTNNRYKDNWPSGYDSQWRKQSTANNINSKPLPNYIEPATALMKERNEEIKAFTETNNNNSGA